MSNIFKLYGGDWNENYGEIINGDLSEEFIKKNLEWFYKDDYNDEKVEFEVDNLKLGYFGRVKNDEFGYLYINIDELRNKVIIIDYMSKLISIVEDDGIKWEEEGYEYDESNMDKSLILMGRKDYNVYLKIN